MTSPYSNISMSCGWNGNSEELVQNFEYCYCIANALHGKFWSVCLKCCYGIPAYFDHPGPFLFPKQEKTIWKHFIKLEYNPEPLVSLSGTGMDLDLFYVTRMYFYWWNYSHNFIFLSLKYFVSMLFHYFNSSVSLLWKLWNLCILDVEASHGSPK